MGKHTVRNQQELLDKSKLGESGSVAEELLQGVPDLYLAFNAAALCVKDGTFTVKESYDAFLKHFETENLREELERLKADERNYYATATVFANAPLALIQYGLSSQINLLERLLGLPISRFPLKKS